MVKLSKFFILGIAAIAAFGVKACGVATLKTAPSIAAGKISVPKARLARAALVSEAGLFDRLSGGSDDDEPAAEGSGVQLPLATFLSLAEGGASPEASIPAPAVDVLTFSVPQLPIGESDAERSIRLAREAEMRVQQSVMQQQQQIQQMQEQQWRLQQQLQSAAGYPPSW